MKVEILFWVFFLFVIYERKKYQFFISLVENVYFKSKKRVNFVWNVYFLLCLLIWIFLMSVGVNVSFHCTFVLGVFRIHVLVYLIEKLRVSSRILDQCQAEALDLGLLSWHDYLKLEWYGSSCICFYGDMNVSELIWTS